MNHQSGGKTSSGYPTQRSLPSTTGNPLNMQHPALELQQRYGNQYVLRMLKAVHSEGHRILQPSVIQRGSKTPGKAKPAPTDDKPRKGSFSDPIIISSEEKMAEFFEKKHVPEKNRIAEPGDLFWDNKDPEFLEKYGVTGWETKITPEQFVSEYGNSPFITFYKYDPPTITDEVNAWADLLNLNFELPEEGAKGSRHGIRGGLGSSAHWGLEVLYVGVSILGIFSFGGKDSKVAPAAEKEAGGFWNRLFGKKTAEAATKAANYKWLSTMSNDVLMAEQAKAVEAFGKLSNQRAIHDFFHNVPLEQTIAKLESGAITKASLVEAGLDQASLEIYGQLSEFILARIERGLSEFKPTKVAQMIATHEERLQAVKEALKLF